MTNNEKLYRQGYGWKKVKVRCASTATCGWEGKRIWRKEMFDKPCPRCKARDRHGKTTLFNPPHMKR